MTTLAHLRRTALHLPPAEVDEVLAAHPTASRLSRPAGVRVPLTDVDGQQLNHWVRRAWLSRAPDADLKQCTT